MTRKVLNVVVAIALIALASLAFTLAPNEAQRQAPVEINVGLGETGSGRNIVATVHDVRLARQAETDSYDPWIGKTTGVWVVVDATVSSGVDPALLKAWLTVDGLTYQASGRPQDDTIAGSSISPGIPLSGSLAFEVPLEIAQSSEPVRITLAPSSDVRLDSTVVVTVRLDERPVEQSAVLWENRLGGPS